MSLIDHDEALFEFDPSSSSTKGKGLSLHVPIDIPTTPLFDNSFDIFDLSLTPYESSQDPVACGSEKGKEREVAPSLPPFAFRLDDPSSWPSPALTSSTSGPSSYSSSYGSPRADDALEQCRLANSAYQSSNSTDNLARILLDEQLPFSVNDDSYDSPLPESRIQFNSSPLTLSTLDIIPDTRLDFQPIPLVRSNDFDYKLPREIRLHILRTLVFTHEQDHINAQADIRWSFSKACSSRNRWVGRDRGFRELVKLSRVSKSWQSLVFDGELWRNVDLHAFPSIPQSLILQLSGPFVKSLNVVGHTSLSSTTLDTITEKLCISVVNQVLTTQLTTLNLRGCTLLSTRSLHGLLMCSPSLSYLYLKGLSIVTNATCDILASYCPKLISLDVGRCLNMDAQGVKAFANAAIERHQHLPLKAIRLSGLKFVDDDTLTALARAAPFLETLDLSYSQHLHNSALEAFVACEEDEEAASLGVSTFILNAREAGRNPTDSGKYKRRRTHLRHLSLSCCILLTDTACSNLARSVPDLETLELAGIGSDLGDDGLIRLLTTTPNIRRIDLEDASSITDAVLAAITPSESSEENVPHVIQPGNALEHLVISHTLNVSSDALLSLVQRCVRLRVLEADNTHVATSVLKEFVRLSRQRMVPNAKIVAVDCREISESVVKELSSMTRPRLGWRAYSARKLKYLDGRDGDLEDLKVGGQDECDDKRVVLKSFYSWQTVDTVNAARDKRHKRRKANDSTSSTASQNSRSITMRWWSPGGRRAANVTPPNLDINNNEGCIIM